MKVESCDYLPMFERVQTLLSLYEGYVSRTIEIGNVLEGESEESEQLIALIQERDQILKSIDNLREKLFAEGLLESEDKRITELIKRILSQIEKGKIYDEKNLRIMNNKMGELKADMKNFQNAKKTTQAYNSYDVKSVPMFLNKKN